jgi:RNA polymerase sigma-70 factor, ECF subfamily
LILVADVTFSGIDQLRSDADQADVALAMDEDAFRAFYERTAPALWAYLSRIAGDRQLADDLLQESYYRLLRARGSFESEAHRRNYLYRIATNLVRDARRRPAPALSPLSDEPSHERTIASGAGNDAERRAGLREAMERLRPRDRALLWLAYAHGSSHEEIAGVLGVKTASIKLLLYRARRRFRALLGEAATGPRAEARETQS